MLSYQLKNALNSIRNNPILSGLLICAIGLGVAMSTASLTVYYIYSGDPIPHKSDRLFYVQLDNWELSSSSNPQDETAPPTQITYRDLLGIMESDIPTHQSGMVATYPTVHPSGVDQRPFRAKTRMCYADFFPMFEVPFRYGSGWDRRADQNAEPVIVLDAKTNDKLFGGANSVGRTLRIEDREFSIVGVLDPWRPKPRFYDTFGRNATREPEGIFMPFAFVERLELDNMGSTICFGDFDDEFAAFLQSECSWIQMWVQLDDDRQREAYHGFLNAYAQQQKKLGRFPRPLNNRLVPVMSWLRDQEVVPDEAKGVLLISLLFLVVCSVNLIGILLGKFLARAPQVGVRRALGASRFSIFTQHLLECELLGVCGGLLGLGLSIAVLQFVNQSLDRGGLFALDGMMIGAGVVLSLVAGAVAGIYPAWRICRVAPATYLKLQ